MTFLGVLHIISFFFDQISDINFYVFVDTKVMETYKHIQFVKQYRFTRYIDNHKNTIHK